MAHLTKKKSFKLHGPLKSTLIQQLKSFWFIFSPFSYLPWAEYDNWLQIILVVGSFPSSMNPPTNPPTKALISLYIAGSLFNTNFAIFLDLGLEKWPSQI